MKKTTTKSKVAPKKKASTKKVLPKVEKKTVKIEEPVYNPSFKMNPVCEDKNSCNCNCGFGRILLGLFLVFLGFIYLAKNFGLLPFSLNFNILDFWPIIIIAVGLSMINKRSKISILLGLLISTVLILFITFFISFSQVKYDYSVDYFTPINRHIEKAKINEVDQIEAMADKIKVDLVKGQEIMSPLTVTGQARGTWYFEASFPIKVIDDAGRQLGTGIAQAEGDWMTEEFVPFTGKINFVKSTSTQGTIVFEKDNPSGLKMYDESLSIPVSF